MSTISVVLFIVGATDENSDSRSDQSSGKTLIKVAFMLFVSVYAIVFVLAAKSASEFNQIPAGERRVLVVVLVAIPLLAVRILLGFLSLFTNWSIFSTTNGSPAVRVCMSIVEEFIIVVIYTFVGLTVPRFDASESAKLEAQVPLTNPSPLPPNAPRSAPYSTLHPNPGSTNRPGWHGVPADRGTVEY